MNNVDHREIPKMSFFGKYIRNTFISSFYLLNSMYNSDQQMKQIVNVQTPLLTADEKSTLHSYELHCFQSFQNQLQIQLRSHWQTGDTEVDESDSDESEREHPDDTDVEETDVCKA